MNQSDSWPRWTGVNYCSVCEVRGCESTSKSHIALIPQWPGMYAPPSSLSSSKYSCAKNRFSHVSWGSCHHNKRLIISSVEFKCRFIISLNNSLAFVEFSIPESDLFPRESGSRGWHQRRQRRTRNRSWQRWTPLPSPPHLCSGGKSRINFERIFPTYYSLYQILWLPRNEGRIVTISNRYTNK